MKTDKPSNRKIFWTRGWALAPAALVKIHRDWQTCSANSSPPSFCWNSICFDSPKPLARLNGFTLRVRANWLGLKMAANIVKHVDAFFMFSTIDPNVMKLFLPGYLLYSRLRMHEASCIYVTPNKALVCPALHCQPFPTEGCVFMPAPLNRQLVKCPRFNCAVNFAVNCDTLLLHARWSGFRIGTMFHMGRNCPCYRWSYCWCETKIKKVGNFLFGPDFWMNTQLRGLQNLLKFSLHILCHMQKRKITNTFQQSTQSKQENAEKGVHGSYITDIQG